MPTRAKFKVQSVTLTVDGCQVLLFPVTSGSPENQEFYKFTPGGKIELAIVNPPAAAMFKPDVEVYVDFNEA